MKKDDEKIKIILDVDTGSDDAIAIAAAVLRKELDVIGICTVGGNVEVKNTTDNTLRVLECCRTGTSPLLQHSSTPPLTTR